MRSSVFLRNVHGVSRAAVRCPSVGFPHLGEALAAVNGAVLTRLEGNLAGLAAGCADCVEHLAGGLVGLLAGVTALFAALGFILKSAGCVELLLTGGENEFLTTFLAHQGLVFVHLLSPLY